MNTLFQTTLAGSLPKPPWLAESERLWPEWKLSGDALLEAQRDATRVCLLEEEHAGIDIVTDGEMARRHFVHGFLTQIEGIDFGKMRRRGIRADRYEADCPTVTGPVRRRGFVHGDEARFARASTDRRLKVTIPGPMTIVDTVYDDHYHSRRELGFALAELIAAEIADLARIGVDVVQLDEPAFNVYFEEVDQWGIDAVDVCVQDAKCTTGVHVCYGYGIKANTDWKATLGEEWDQYDIVLPLLARSKADQVLIELTGSRVPARVLGHLAGKKQVAVGAIDVASNDIETPQDVCATIERAREFLPDDAILAGTNCGMAPMPREVAYAKLRALGAGAALARERAGKRAPTPAR